MIPAQTAQHRADIPFTTADFQAIAQRVKRDFGLYLPDTKKELVYSRLLKRLRLLGIDDFRRYCALVDSAEGHEERLRMLSALTTNVTHFMREEHHFKMLRETVLPPLLAACRSGGRLRLWSAGCSAGQEPYSLAFTILALCPEAPRLDIRILATDVDPEVLEQARAGTYRLEELDAIPEPARRQHVERERNAETFSIGPAARALVRFGALNLIEAWPMRGPFDVIFCRNVAIYFDRPTQERLWSRFAGMLAPGGHLFIGHSERISGEAEALFRSAGVTAYRQENRNGGRTAPAEGAIAWP